MGTKLQPVTMAYVQQAAANVLVVRSSRAALDCMRYQTGA